MKNTELTLISHFWARVADVQDREGDKLYSCAHGIFKNIALAWVGVVCAICAAADAKATPVAWERLDQVLYDDGGIQSVVYSTTVTLNGAGTARNLLLVYYLNVGPSTYASVGGFFVQAGATSGTGWINRDNTDFWGINTGESLNTGSAPDGYWEVAYDYNNNGRFGEIDGVTGIPISYEPGERLNGYDGFSINISELPAFPSSNTPQSGGVIEIHSDVVVPEPSTSALKALGVTSLGGGTNQLTLSVIVSNAATFSVTYKDSLTNSIWESLGTYSKTGAVTVITDTNNVPQRFYRVVTP